MKIWVNGYEWAKQQARKPGSASPSCPTDSPPPRMRRCCRRSATRCNPARSRCSSSAGWPGSRCRSGPADQRAGTGGSCSMAQVEVSARSCSTHPATPAPSSTPWSPTTSTSADRTPSRSSSTGGSALTPPQVQDENRHPRHRGHRQRLLQALPDQAIPERPARLAVCSKQRNPAQLSHAVNIAGMR